MNLSSINPVVGLVGDTVTINGSKFGSTQGSSVVTFYNGVEATITSWSDTSIQVKVPVGFSTGPVTVTTTDGTSNGVVFRDQSAPAFALDFDGIDDYVNIPHHNSLNFGSGDFTVEAWVKTSSTKSQNIVGKYNGSDAGWVLGLQR